MRTFIAVDLPLSHKKKIELNTRNARSQFPQLKWVEPHNLHITLKFLGEIKERQLGDVEKAVRQVASKFSPFELQIGHADSFDAGGSIRVLWLAVVKGAETLTNMAREIDRELVKFGFQREKRPFQAHLTIARSRKYGPRIRFSQLGLTRESLPPFTVREIVIYKSTLTPNGPIYEQLRTVGLKR